MRSIVAAFILIALLPAASLAETEKKSEVSAIFYSEFGGMVNSSLDMDLERKEQGSEPVLTIRSRMGDSTKTRRFKVSDEDMEVLARMIEAYDPENWENLPESELIALDAPISQVELVYADGRRAEVSDSKEISGALFYRTEQFLKSYDAKKAKAAELTFDSFEGGPWYRAVLSDPAMVRVESSRKYNRPAFLRGKGEKFQEQLVFIGRIPGKTELVIDVEEGMKQHEGIRTPVLFEVEVDSGYNVTLTEKDPGKE